MLRYVFILSVNLILGQTPKLDSLHKVLGASQNIEDKIETLSTISLAHRSVHLDSVYLIAKEVGVLSKRANYKKGIFLSQRNIAVYYMRKSEMDSALFYFKKSAEYALHIKDSILAAQSFNNVGTVYNLKRDLYNAIYYREKAYDIAFKTNNIKSQSAILNNIANVYNYINDYDNATIYYQRALDIVGSEVAFELQIKINLAKIYINTKSYAKAIELLQEVTEKAKATNNFDLLAVAFSELAKANAIAGNVEEAIKNYKQVLDLSQYNLEDYTIAKVHIGLGQLYFKKQQIGLALLAANTGNALAKKIKQPDLLFDGNKLLFDIYTHKKEYKKANDFSSQASIYQDSLSKIKINNQTSKRLIAYQRKIKEIEEINENNVLRLENNLLRSKSNRNILIAILSFIGLTCSILIYKNNRIRKEKNIAKLNLKQKIELEEKIHKIEDNIAADLHDNFGNRLTAIQSAYNIVKEYNLEEKVKDDNYFMFSSHLENKLFQLSTDIKDLLWAMNQNNNKVFPLIDRVLKIVNAFEETTNKKVEVEIEMKKNYGFPKYTVKQLLLIIKEIIHNFDKHSESDLLKIKFTSINDKIHIVTQDFGVGFKISDLTRVNGLNNIKKRAESIGFSTEFNSEINKFTKIELISRIKLV